MTCEEALKYLDEHCTAHGIPFRVKIACSNALEKQIPKKPLSLIRSNGVQLNWRCPDCGRAHGSSCFVPFCKWCGQRIDWSEVK